MKKIILIDGNNLMFRSYYATAYTGTILKTKAGFPTNALYGFTSMINKIINEENPDYIAVAFDIGKNFRFEKYPEYKAGRNATPQELKDQMVVARELLTAMGIKYLEMEPYEADDIIGTLAKMALDDPEFIATIISSDKDLLQLINTEVDVKLLKQKGFVRYDTNSFFQEYKINPLNIIDLKALVGDPSDNIPGVKGIGEKTALTLLEEYLTIENLYDHIGDIKGKLQEKLLMGKDQAFFSKELATIYLEVPLNIPLESLKYLGPNNEELISMYTNLEFYSFVNKVAQPLKKLSFIKINDVKELVLNETSAYYIAFNEDNYHQSGVVGMGIVNDHQKYFIKPELINDVINKYRDKLCYTYNYKAAYYIFPSLKCEYDIMLMSYLLDANKNSLNSLMEKEQLITADNELEQIINAANFIYTIKDRWYEELKKLDMLSLYDEIELPLTTILADMEREGVLVNQEILDSIQKELEIRLEEVEQQIHYLAEKTFNISSPLQLGKVLFDDLKLPYYKTKKDDKYKTDVKVLHQLIDAHPIVRLVLTYRNISKILGTYVIGLKNFISNDGKVHTIYNQALTRTGRLSSIEPNMQNMPIRDEEGKKIRQAFIPSNDLFISADYSQIELRVLAHITKSKELIKAFADHEDIHTKIAADVYGVDFKDVTKSMRRNAKAVIFGIIYGISGFGLGENLEISPKEAKQLIDKYLELYPEVKKYMDDIVKDAYQKGYVETLYHRRRHIEELKSSQFMVRNAGERIALNTPIQGTAADILKMAMVEIARRFKKEDIKSKLVLQVHDEIIIDTINAEKELVKKIIREAMENIVSLDVPLEISLDEGTDWSEI